MDKQALKIDHLNQIGAFGWSGHNQLKMHTTFIFPLPDVDLKSVVTGLRHLHDINCWKTIGHPYILHSLFPCILNGEFYCAVLERERFGYRAIAIGDEFGAQYSTLKDSCKSVDQLFYPGLISVMVAANAQRLQRWDYSQVPRNIWNLHCMVAQSKCKKVQYSELHFDDSVDLVEYFRTNLNKERKLTDSPYYILALEYNYKLSLVLIRCTLNSVIFCEPNTNPVHNLQEAIDAFEETYPFSVKELSKILQNKMPCTSCSCIIA